MKMSMWTKYEIKWQFVTKLCASVPANPNVLEAWLKARQPRVKPPGGKTISEINEEVVASLREQPDEEDGQYALLVFQSESKRLVVRAETVRAHLKDCARVLSRLYIGKVQGEKSLGVRVKDGIYMDLSEYWLPILHEGTGTYTEADGRMERFVHTINPKTGAPINAIKCFEFIECPTLIFTLKVLGNCVKQEDLETIMEYGGTHGYGGERSAGEGKYVFEIKLKEERDESTKTQAVTDSDRTKRSPRNAVQRSNFRTS